MEEIRFKHVKKKVIDYVSNVNDNPHNWRLNQLINNPKVHIKKLLPQMEREGLIKINRVEQPSGKVLRYIVPTEFGKEIR